MRLRPPRSTRTDTLFPYTTLFRSQFIQDHQIDVHQPVRHLPGLVLRLLQLQGVDQLDRGEEAHPLAMQDRKSTRLELQSLMRISYAVFCLKKKKTTTENTVKQSIDIYSSHQRNNRHLKYDKP